MSDITYLIRDSIFSDNFEKAIVNWKNHDKFFRYNIVFLPILSTLKEVYFDVIIFKGSKVLIDAQNGHEKAIYEHKKKSKNLPFSKLFKINKNIYGYKNELLVKSQKKISEINQDLKKILDKKNEFKYSVFSQANLNSIDFSLDFVDSTNCKDAIRSCLRLNEHLINTPEISYKKDIYLPKIGVSGREALSNLRKTYVDLNNVKKIAIPNLKKSVNEKQEDLELNVEKAMENILESSYSIIFKEFLLS